MTIHHDSCPFCDQQLLGVTDADLVQHIAEDHDLSSTQPRKTVCDNCDREFVTYMGECPYCHHGGEPYK